MLLQANWRSGRWCCMAPLCTRTSFEAKSLALQKSWRTPTRSSQRSTTVGNKSSHGSPQSRRFKVPPSFWKLPFLPPQVKFHEIIQLCHSRPLRSRVQRTWLWRSGTPPLHQLSPLLPQVQEQHQVRGYVVRVEENVLRWCYRTSIISASVWLGKKGGTRWMLPILELHDTSVFDLKNKIK